MKAGFYPKLAATSISKNKRMYLPYILNCIGMVMMYYIIVFLQYNDIMSSLPGGATIREMMNLGGWVIAIFSCIFLFYTNSFLIRRRKKEFGLYNILGMGKRNISIILFWESLIISVISLGIGILAGIMFSKIAELGLINIMNSSVNYSLSVSPGAILMTIAVFGMIFLLLFLNSVRQIKFANAVSLIKSENIGEKPPKGNWILGILGVILLGVAYYISATIKNPITAISIFFIAVIMVILGTYLIMISGSVLFCRILQRKKNYYYKPNHFVSVSSMVYRMKRNGAGLASICILATMVLVMISSTASLYFGAEDSLHSRYPREINMDFQFYDTEEKADENIIKIRDDILTLAKAHDATLTNLQEYRRASVTGLLTGNTVELDVSAINDFNLNTYSDVCQFQIIPIEDYNKMMGTNETLENGEAILHMYRKNTYNFDTISFNNGQTFKVKKIVNKFIDNGDVTMDILPTITIFVPNLNDAISGINELADFNGDRMVTLKWIYNFDTGFDKDKQTKFTNDMVEFMKNSIMSEKYENCHCSIEDRESNRIDFYSLYGGLFYLGMILSIVFLFAAVLIIYYKQISEGYEDQSRFDIMQKVGMTKKEIRKSINSQLLTVFFLPLIFAGLHLTFAFPIVRKLLIMFNLNNVALFAATTVIIFLVFALLYTLVYRITSNAYYNIVSGAKKRNE